MNIYTYDIETYGLGGELCAIGLYDGNKFYSFDSVPKFLLCVKNRDYGLYYAHNGGKYDVKYIIEYILESGICYCDFLDVHGHIILKLYHDEAHKRKICEFRDSRLLMSYSLDKLSKSFNVAHKKQDYDDYQEHKDKEKMMEYLKYDCVSLYEILEKFISILNITVPKLTIASTSMHIFREQFNGNEYLSSLHNIGNGDIFRNGYYGGRTEVIRRYGTNLNYYDINSLYPSVMINDFPIGQPKQTNSEKGEMGYYLISVDIPYMKIPPLPYRYNSRLIFPYGQFTNWYYTPELRLLDLLGIEYDVIKGFYWDETSRPFDAYINYYYDIKRKSEGAQREIAKLMLNSVYGKFGQRSKAKKHIDLNTVTEHELMNCDIEVLDYKNGIGVKHTEIFSNHIFPFVSGVITSYARKRLYEFILKCGEDSIYYMDTDSLITDKTLKTSNKIGDMKKVDDIKEGVFLLPKLYAYENDKEELTKRSKGFNSEYIPFSAYKQALYEDDFSGFKTKVKRVVGFSEKLRYGKTDHFYSVISYEKNVSGIFNKRILINPYDTEPININTLSDR